MIFNSVCAEVLSICFCQASESVMSKSNVFKEVEEIFDAFPVGCKGLLTLELSALMAWACPNTVVTTLAANIQLIATENTISITVKP